MFLLRDDINEIGAMIKAGKIICYPTDTVWALGCDATNSAAVQAIRSIKNIPDTEGLVVLVNSIDMLKSLVEEIPPRIETLLALHHRPFTLVYTLKGGLSQNVCAEDGTVAIRFTNDEFCATLIDIAGGPIVSTIAAMHGAPHPANFGGVSSSILGSADYVVKHRQDDKRTNEPSPLARLDQFQELEFIRE